MPEPTYPSPCSWHGPSSLMLHGRDDGCPARPRASSHRRRARRAHHRGAGCRGRGSCRSRACGLRPVYASRDHRALARRAPQPRPVTWSGSARLPRVASPGSSPEAGAACSRAAAARGSSPCPPYGCPPRLRPPSWSRPGEGDDDSEGAPAAVAPHASGRRKASDDEGRSRRPSLYTNWGPNAAEPSAQVEAAQ